MTTQTQQVAQTILSQLGGKRFIAMTGCSNFGSTPNSLSFKLAAVTATPSRRGVRVASSQPGTPATT